eukprot:COSAG02_NODE_1424_length_12684_cov_13.471116_3_plen_81_part_00
MNCSIHAHLRHSLTASRQTSSSPPRLTAPSQHPFQPPSRVRARDTGCVSALMQAAGASQLNVRDGEGLSRRITSFSRWLR